MKDLGGTGCGEFTFPFQITNTIKKNIEIKT